MTRTDKGKVADVLCRMSERVDEEFAMLKAAVDYHRKVCGGSVARRQLASAALRFSEHCSDMNALQEVYASMDGPESESDGVIVTWACDDGEV